MKTRSKNNYSTFHKVMIIIVPIIIMLLIASVVTLAAMYFTHNFGGFGLFSPGNIVIIMASCSTLLAIVGLIFAFFSPGKNDDEDNDDEDE